jgi:cation transport regulator ChaC
MFKYLSALLRRIMRKPNDDVIGILAYGSLIEDPGERITQLLINRIDTVTPFPVEYARTSRTRGNAPTLIPFESGAQVKAQILVLRAETSVQVASNILYQRETRQTERNYARPNETNITSGTVLVEELTNFENIKTVLYTKIGSNIPNLTAHYLATNAIASARGSAGETRKDGISYLINAKRNGIETSISGSYEEEILRLTESNSLEDAYHRCRESAN